MVGVGYGAGSGPRQLQTLQIYPDQGREQAKTTNECSRLDNSTFYGV